MSKNDMAVAAVIAINRKARLAILDSGAVVEIASMIDLDGNETNDPEQCFCAIVPLPCGRWACCDLGEFEDVSSH